MRTIYGIGLLVLLSAGLAGCSESPQAAALPPYTARATLSTNIIRIGDEAIVDVVVAHPTESRVLPFDPSRNRDIVLRSRDSRTVASEEDQALFETSMRFDITSWTLGTHIVSTNAIEVRDEDGSIRAVPFPELSITVESAITDTNLSFRSIKGLAEWNASQKTFPWFLALLVLLGVVLLVAGTLYMIFRKSGEATETAPPPIPAHRVALDALSVLFARGWIESRNIEPFYVTLSHIVRKYLEDRFHIHAPEQTTEEFIRDTAASHRLSLDHQVLVRRFLEQADLVKFARFEPESSDMQNAYDAAIRLVNETIPPEDKP